MHGTRHRIARLHPIAFLVLAFVAVQAQAAGTGGYVRGAVVAEVLGPIGDPPSQPPEWHPGESSRVCVPMVGTPEALAELLELDDNPEAGGEMCASASMGWNFHADSDCEGTKPDTHWICAAPGGGAHAGSTYGSGEAVWQTDADPNNASGSCGWDTPDGCGIDLSHGDPHWHETGRGDEASCHAVSIEAFSPLYGTVSAAATSCL